MIHFYDEGTKTRLPQKRRLKTYLKDLFQQEGRSLSLLNYIFCSDDFLLQINREFLEHDDLTDIITFSYAPKKKPIQGEVYISTDRIKENEKAFESGYNTELHRVIFHGALHLCGYKDKTKIQKMAMRQMEDIYLSGYGLI
jgi:probable rRNA maturation factor